MRLWTLHPQYLDTKGLLAVWREGLLAQKVLRGETRGYRQHPQLTRFRQHAEPLAALTFYLHGVWEEGARRGYHFDASKLSEPCPAERMPVTLGQVEYEWGHLLAKLALRDPSRLLLLEGVESPALHALFYAVPGAVEDWERLR